MTANLPDRDRLAAIRAVYADDATSDVRPVWVDDLDDLLAAAEEALRLRDAVDRVTALCDGKADGWYLTAAAVRSALAQTTLDEQASRSWRAYDEERGYADPEAPAVVAAITDALGEGT